MKVCRLKIITANIIDDIDTPKIHYISQNKQPIMTNNNEEKENNLFQNIEININQNENLEKINEEKIQIETKESINNNLENKTTNNINGNELYNTNNFLDINDLCTISSKNLNEDKKINNILNYIEENNLNSNYPYAIMTKKKGLNNLRNLFKSRIKRKNKSINLSPNKSLSLSKSNSKHKFTKKISKSSYKTNINLNQSNKLNKSIGLKNFKSSGLLTIKKNSNEINDKNRTIHHYKFRAKKNNLKTKKNENQENKENKENASNIETSWKIYENNMYISQDVDYKSLIDTLIIKECELVKEKEQLIQIYEKKLSPLRELNRRLLEDNNEEINRKDELKGELILLKIQYEKLFNTLNPKDKKIINNNNNNNIINNTFEDKKFNEKLKEIGDEIKILNEQFKKGEIIIITKPAKYQKLSEETINDISILLKGLFVSKHIFNTDIIVDKIWKFDKPFQTIYFLVKELLKLFNLEHNDRNKLINYFYSFCKYYNYMNINEFKKLFGENIGKINIYNKDMHISQLLNFYKSKVKILMKSLVKKDMLGRGVINYYKFVTLLYDNGINFNSNEENYEEMIEFLVYCMKKDRTLDLYENEEDEIDKKYSLFDLFYESLNDFIKEFNGNAIMNPYYVIRNYMNENGIMNAEQLMMPILTNKNILVIDSVKYIDIILLNKYLKFKAIIQTDDKIVVNVFEEELVDVNKFINNIYNEQDNEDKKADYEDIKNKANDLIDDILKLNY